MISHDMQQVYLDIFLSVTMVALGAGVHCMLTSTFTAIWGPGLALRGPRGSVAKAYAAMRRQKHQITGSFVALIGFFFIQTGIAVWLCPISNVQKWIATSIVILSAFFTVKTMQSLHQQVNGRGSVHCHLKNMNPPRPTTHDPRPTIHDQHTRYALIHRVAIIPHMLPGIIRLCSSSLFSSAAAVGSSVRKHRMRRTR